MADIAKLGLTLETAVGKRFTFVMDDADENGNPDDIMFNGVVAYGGTRSVAPVYHSGVLASYELRPIPALKVL